jgi:hypothetical protein
MALKKIPYGKASLLIDDYLSIEEDEPAAQLIRQFRLAKKRGYLTRAELEAVCRWKSARAIHHIKSNSPSKVRNATRRAFATRSERRRLEELTSLRGVSIPMASAILMLCDPRRYGVIDIRVWQLLHAVGAVTKKSSGIGFNFSNWYQFLMIIRYFSKRLGVTARNIERTLFLAHKEYQEGRLYSTIRKSTV